MCKPIIHKIYCLLLFIGLFYQRIEYLLVNIELIFLTESKEAKLKIWVKTVSKYVYYIYI